MYKPNRIFYCTQRIIQLLRELERKRLREQMRVMNDASQLVATE